VKQVSAFLFALLALGSTANAQSVRGTILGTVMDLFNHPNFDNPNVVDTSSTFGRITSAGVQDTRASSRQIQFALRLVF